MSEESTRADVLDVLGSEVNRDILALGSVRPLSAEELAEHCDVSQPTIYRRLDTLRDHGLVDAMVELDDDGNHYHRFRTTLEEATVTVEEGRFHVDLQLEKDYAGKFADFWRDLERGAEDISGDAADSSTGLDAE